MAQYIVLYIDRDREEFNLCEIEHRFFETENEALSFACQLAVRYIRELDVQSLHLTDGETALLDREFSGDRDDYYKLLQILEILMEEMNENYITQIDIRKIK